MIEALPPLSTAEPAIAINGVDHSYGAGENSLQVLFQNELAIMPGEIVIMTGPSGSGKTTLLTLIGALRSVQAGSLKVFGQELHGLNATAMQHVRRNIGFIFQAHNLFDSLTATQTLRMAMQLTPQTKEALQNRPRAMLEQLGLGHRMDKKPESLSGGQRQRVAIGRALIHHPKLILADEPTAALDKDSGQNVVEILQQRARDEQCTILIVTHDNRILGAADRIVNMVDGRIVSNVRVKETMLITGILKQCKVFKEMTPGDLSDIAQKMTREDFADGIRVIRQGDAGDKFYVVAAGKAVVEVANNDTGSNLVAALETGSFFGEVALLKDQPRNASVIADGPLTCYSLSKPDFLEAVRKLKTFEEQLSAQLFHRGG